MTKERKYALGALFGPARYDMTQYTPHARRLRMRVVETGPGAAILTLPYHPELIGDPARGVVFGGVITTLIDQASGLAVACAMEELTAIATIRASTCSRARSATSSPGTSPSSARARGSATRAIPSRAAPRPS